MTSLADQQSTCHLWQGKFFKSLRLSLAVLVTLGESQALPGDSSNGHLHASHLHHVAHQRSNPVLEGLLFVLPPTRSQCMYRLSTKSHLGENGTLIRVLLHPLSTVSSFGQLAAGPVPAGAQSGLCTGLKVTVMWSFGPWNLNAKPNLLLQPWPFSHGQDHPVLACGQGPVTREDSGALTGQRRPLVFTITILASALPILVSWGQVTLAQQDVGLGETG